MEICLRLLGTERITVSGTLEVQGNLTQQPSAGSKSLYMDMTKLVLSGEKAESYFVEPGKGNAELFRENGYSAIRGFIAKYDDVSHIKGYYDVVESFRLDYVVNGKRPFPEGGDTYGYIKFKTDHVEEIGIPFGKKMGGVNTDVPPCTLNGFTGARNGEIIAEWFVDGGNAIELIDGSELHQVVNGVDTIIAIYENGHFIESK